jgi:hypothetical protein
MLTDSPANGTFLALKVRTGFRVNVSDKRNGLREIYMDGFIQRQVLIIGIRDLDRAVLYTGGATRAFLLHNVSGLFNQGNLEVFCLPFYPVNFSIGQDVYIGMSATINKLRRFNAHGAVIRGKGLIKLGHLAANGRRFINQVNPKTRIGKIKGGLNTADPTTDNQNISKIIFCGTIN